MSTRRNRGWTGRGDISDFMPAPIEAEDREVEVWDGTLGHLHTLGRIAAARITFRGMPHDEMAEIATSEIAYQLALDPDTPIPDLLLLGQQAVGNEVNSVLASHGQRHGENRTGARFAVYWSHKRTHYDSYGLDRLAARQVWEALREDDQRMLLARSAHGTYRQMAADLGVKEDTCRRWTIRARQAALDLWFDWETAPEPVTDVKRQATHCKHGHDLDVHGQYYTDNRTARKKRRCGECARIRYKKKAAA